MLISGRLVVCCILIDRCKALCLLMYVPSNGFFFCFKFKIDVCFPLCCILIDRCKVLNKHFTHILHTTCELWLSP